MRDVLLQQRKIILRSKYIIALRDLISPCIEDQTFTGNIFSGILCGQEMVTDRKI